MTTITQPQAAGLLQCGRGTAGFASNEQAIFFIGLVLFMLFSIPTLIVGKEQRYIAPKPTVDVVVTCGDKVRRHWRRLRAVPNWFWRLCLVYFFSSAAATGILFNWTDFVASSVFGLISFRARLG